MPLLDLTDRQDFEPLPAGKYRCTVIEASEEETSGQGKLPAGWPMIALTWKVEDALFDTEEEYEGRQVFTRNVIPQKEIDGEPYKYFKMMNGMIFRLLEALGYTEDELNNKKFQLDYEDLKGREAILTVNRREWTDPETDEVRLSNEVKGVKAVTDSAGVI